MPVGLVAVGIDEALPPYALLRRMKGGEGRVRDQLLGIAMFRRGEAEGERHVDKTAAFDRRAHHCRDGVDTVVEAFLTPRSFAPGQAGLAGEGNVRSPLRREKGLLGKVWLWMGMLR